MEATVFLRCSGLRMSLHIIWRPVMIGESRYGRGWEYVEVQARLRSLPEWLPEIEYRTALIKTPR